MRCFLCRFHLGRIAVQKNDGEGDIQQQDYVTGEA